MLNSSGIISIGGSTLGQSINVELGRSSTASSNLNESALRTLADKSSGVIALSDFYGKGVSISNASVSHITTSPDNATATYELTNAGDVNTYSPSVSDIGDWITPKAAASGTYEVKATVTSGVTPSGSATETWLSLSASRSWYIDTTFGSKSSYLTIEIRANGVVLDSASVDLYVESSI